jgi:hypothetical protein
MKKHTTLFTASIILFWANWLLLGITWNNFQYVPYTIFNLILLPIYLMILVTSFMLIIRVIRKLKKENGTYKAKELFGVLFLILIITTIVVVHFNEYNKATSKNYNISGFGPITSKNIKDDNYYFYIARDNTNIIFQSDQKTYEKLIVDDKVLYTFEYRLDFFNQRKGIIKNIDLENYIDNRTRLID